MIRWHKALLIILLCSATRPHCACDPKFDFDRLDSLKHHAPATATYDKYVRHTAFSKVAIFFSLFYVNYYFYFAAAAPYSAAPTFDTLP